MELLQGGGPNRHLIRTMLLFLLVLLGSTAAGRGRGRGGGRSGRGDRGFAQQEVTEINTSFTEVQVLPDPINGIDNIDNTTTMISPVNPGYNQSRREDNVKDETRSELSSSRQSSSSQKQDKHKLLAAQRSMTPALPSSGGSHLGPKSDVQIGCKELRSKRYISDGFCTSIKPVTEVVCTGHCLPMTNLPWYAEFIKVWARTKVLEWRCVNDVVKRRRVRLLCENGETRTYRIKVVKSCKCKRYMKQQNQSMPHKGRNYHNNNNNNGSSQHHRRREKDAYYAGKKSRTNRVPS